MRTIGPWIGVVTMAALTAVLACCPRAASPPPATPATIIAPISPCLDSPPPAPRLWATVREHCPADLVCLSADGGLAILEYLEQLDLYASHAWTLCGPAPAPATQPVRP